MRRGGGVDEAGVGTTVGVATALDELKSRGSALLIVGTVPESIYARLSAQLLGEGPDRRRLIVERRRSPERRLESIDRWTPEWTRVFECQITPRRSTAADNTDVSGGCQRTDRAPETNSATAPSLPDDERPGSVAETVDGSVVDLGTAVGDAIVWLDDVAGGLDPAELRVAFDCVGPLLSEYPQQAVFRFLHLLTYQIRAVNGTGHVRLSRPLDSDPVRVLAPLFDAVVELRLDGTEAVHRWHFRDAAVTSEWLPVDRIA